MLVRREVSERVMGADDLIEPSAVLSFTDLPVTELNVAGALLKLSAFIGEVGWSKSRSRVGIWILRARDCEDVAGGLALAAMRSFRDADEWSDGLPFA